MTTETSGTIPAPSNHACPAARPSFGEGHAAARGARRSAWLDATPARPSSPAPVRWERSSDDRGRAWLGVGLDEDVRDLGPRELDRRALAAAEHLPHHRARQEDVRVAAVRA